MTSFTVVEAIEVVPILQLRLPESAHIYNMAILSKNRRLSKPSFFLLDFTDKISPNSWIVAFGDYKQDLYGVRCCISAPKNATPTKEIFDAFSQTKIFDWTQRYMFCAIERNISDFMVKMLKHGRETCKINSTMLKYYVMFEDPVAALDTLEDQIEVKPLDVNQGAKFLTDTWEYSKTTTNAYVTELLGQTESAGVYIDGHPVSGIIETEQGLMGMLYTLEEYRRRGFGALVMKTLMKNLVSLGAVPTSSVYPQNTSSIKFHEKVGMRFSRLGDNIDYIPLPDKISKDISE